MHGFVCVIERSGITWAVRQKNSVGIEGQHFLSRCPSGDDGDLEALLPKQAQNIFLNSVVVCGDSEAGWWQGSSSLSVRRFLNRPWRAEFVLRIPAIIFFR